MCDFSSFKNVALGHPEHHRRTSSVSDCYASKYTNGYTVPITGNFVERREAVKLYLAHKLARFFIIFFCCRVLNVPTRARALETGTGYTRYMRVTSLALIGQVTCERYCTT